MKTTLQSTLIGLLGTAALVGSPTRVEAAGPIGQPTNLVFSGAGLIYEVPTGTTRTFLHTVAGLAFESGAELLLDPGSGLDTGGVYITDVSSSASISGQLSVGLLSNWGNVAVSSSGSITTGGAQALVTNYGMLVNSGSVIGSTLTNTVNPACPSGNICYGVYENFSGAYTGFTSIYNGLGTGGHTSIVVNNGTLSAGSIQNDGDIDSGGSLGTSSVTNNGSISNSGAWSSGSLVNNGSLTNSGSISVTAGTITMTSGSGITLGNGSQGHSSGSFINQGELDLVGSSFSTTDSSVFQNTGTVRVDASPGSNSSLLLHYAGTNLSNLQNCGGGGCTLSGGTWIADGLYGFNSSGAVSGRAEIEVGTGNLAGSYVPINRIDTNTNVQLIGNAVWNQLGGLTSNAGSFAVGGPSWTFNNGFANSGSIVNMAPQPNTGTPVMTVTGNFSNSGTITNQSNFVVAAGAFLYGNGSYLQQAGVTSVNGTMEVGSVDVSGGKMVVTGKLATPQLSLSGTGMLSGGGTVTATVLQSGGTLAPGDPQTLTINGDLTMTGGIIDLQIAGAGAGQHDVLNITGAASLSGGTIVLDFIDGYAPRKGDMVLQLFEAAGGISGLSNVTFATEGLAAGFNYELQGGNSGTLSLDALNDGVATSPAPVPIPGAVWLMLSGLGGLGALARARVAA